jgi:tetratricopeptide (TPR) repeat protein/capsular polysaccharide biosynthesis protein
MILAMEVNAQLKNPQSALLYESHSPESCYQLGVSFYNLGQYSPAKECYLKAIALKPDYAQAYFYLALIAETEGDNKQAIAHYEKAILYRINNQEAYNNIGYLLQREKKFAEALKYYQQGLEYDPLWPGIYNNMGYLFWQQEQSDQALIYLTRALKLDPNLAIAHYNLALVWLKQSNYSEAVRCFEQVIRLEPTNINAYSYCGQCLIRLGKFEQAWLTIAQGLILKPLFVQVWINRVKQLSGTDLLERGQLNLAAFLEGLLNKQKWSEISHYLYHTYLYRADVWFEYGSYLPAEAYYQIALQFNLKNIEVYLGLGKALAKQKRLESAILIYHLALSIEPEHPKILFQLAQTLTEQKRFAEAINYYEKLFKLGDTDRLSISPSLTPKNPPTPPQGIYPTTKGWLEAKRLKSYIQVHWGNEQVKSETPNPYLMAAPETRILHQCAGVNCFSCMNKLCDLFQAREIESEIYFCYQDQPLNLEKPETFIAMIPQGRAWIVPQKNHWLICNAIAIVTPDNYLLGDLSRFYPWKLPGCDQHDLRSHPIFSLEEIPPVETLEGNVVILSTLAAHVYYHWLIDLIPRLGMMIKSGLNLEKVDWFVVNKLTEPYQKETLEKLGIPLNKIIESDRHPHIQAQRLIVPSWAGALDWPLSGSINFLRETYLKQELSTGKKYPPRIYISRSKSRHRQVINEPEVLELIGKYGFIPIFLECLSFSEQVALFKNADYIIAPHGSGLTNILFCDPETTIIEFFAPRYLRSDYLIISQQLQLKHYYLLGESFECAPVRELMYESPITDDILVKLDRLQRLLTLLFPEN